MDIDTQHNLPDFIMNRGGVSLRPGDGIIHSWLNRMLLPDTVGTGGDSHTRFPMGISLPQEVLVWWLLLRRPVLCLWICLNLYWCALKARCNPALPCATWYMPFPTTASKKALLTVEKKNKKNFFSGRILEIEGLDTLTVEQAFELSDASAERSAAGCTIKLARIRWPNTCAPISRLLRWMIAEGYGDVRTLERRVQSMEAWLANPSLMSADADAEYAAVIEIDLADINEPIVCCPNDPDDARLLSEVAGDKVDEIFIGSCMTNIGHFRGWQAAG